MVKMMFKLSSKDRIVGDSSDFTLKLGAGIDELKGDYKCVMVSIPVYWYNIDEDSKRIPLSVGGNEVVAELKVGYYDSENIGAAIVSALNAVGGGAVFGCAFDALTKKLRISCDAAFTLKFSGNVGIRDVLGFRAVDYASVVDGGSNVVVGELGPNFNPVRSININIDGCKDSVIQTNGMSCSIMCPVVYPQFWSLNTFEFKNPPIVSFGSSMRQLRIRVVNSDNGKVLNLNGAEWFFMLEKI